MTRSNRIWKPVLTIVVGLLLFKAIGFALFCLTFLVLPSGDVEGPAPNESFQLRRNWGKRNFGVLFTGAEKWVRENAKISESIGTVLDVAPIDGPNKYCEGFGGASAAMNLQVVGENGEGILELKKVTFIHDEKGEEVWIIKPAGALKISSHKVGAKKSAAD